MRNTSILEHPSHGGYRGRVASFAQDELCRAVAGECRGYPEAFRMLALGPRGVIFKPTPRDRKMMSALRSFRSGTQITIGVRHKESGRPQDRASATSPSSGSCRESIRVRASRGSGVCRSTCATGRVLQGIRRHLVHQPARSYKARHEMDLPAAGPLKQPAKRAAYGRYAGP